jgi:hypothetical protein
MIIFNKLHPFLKWAAVAAAVTGLLTAASWGGVLPGLPGVDLLVVELILVTAFLLGRRLIMELSAALSGQMVLETVLASALGLGILSSVFFLQLYSD